MSPRHAHRAVAAQELDGLAQRRDSKLGRGALFAVRLPAVVVHARVGVHRAPALVDAVGLAAVLALVVLEAALFPLGTLGEVGTALALICLDLVVVVVVVAVAVVVQRLDAKVVDGRAAVQVPYWQGWGFEVAVFIGAVLVNLLQLLAQANCKKGGWNERARKHIHDPVTNDIPLNTRHLIRRPPTNHSPRPPLAIDIPLHHLPDTHHLPQPVGLDKHVPALFDSAPPQQRALDGKVHPDLPPGAVVPKVLLMATCRGAPVPPPPPLGRRRVPRLLKGRHVGRRQRHALEAHQPERGCVVGRIGERVDEVLFELGQGWILGWRGWRCRCQGGEDGEGEG